MPLEPLDGRVEDLLVEMVLIHYNVMQTDDNLHPEDDVGVRNGEGYQSF